MSGAHIDELEPGSELRAIVEKFEHGQVCRGVVTTITWFGIFVDIGGVDGMVSAANASRRRFERFEDLVRVGQEVVVTILDVDLDRLRISLSLTAWEDRQAGAG
uniref:S1 RNA-binding domain-containing protein n=1 Tax=Herbidospora sakaeratensis TaxID=564415 RepID=UPI000A5B315A|nr:S1 RNA-binding domain-containing protein [Herbidospora sakaeratensis]